MRTEVLDHRGLLERRVRRGWASPPPLLRGLAALHATASGLRGAGWELGLARPRRVGATVVSVGGLGAGGSGKTPLVAELAVWLAEEGRRPAIATHGLEDEMAVHRRLSPGVPIAGCRRLFRAARALAERGADTVVVDGGFQHRALHRDLDVVTLGPVEGSGRLLPLPAGPGREPHAALLRADAVVLVDRDGGKGRGSAAGEEGRGTIRWLRRYLPHLTVARCRLEPTGLVPVNRAARQVEPAPAVAMASIMYPGFFLAALDRQGICPGRAYLFPDHGRPGPDLLREMLRVAGRRGIVGTLKDVVKVRRTVGESTPLWFLAERPSWVVGEAGLRRLLRRLPTDASATGGAPEGRR